MSKRPANTIFTEVDNRVNCINDIGEVCIVSANLSQIISHLEQFVREEIDESVSRNIMIKQVPLIEKASSYIRNE